MSDPAWTSLISQAWRREPVEAIVGELPNAVRQPDEWQSEFKCSYFLAHGAAESLAQIERHLAIERLEAKIAVSADRFLDILPARSGKGEAVRYLTDLLCIPPEGVITSGDTSNDLDTMRPELGFHSIAVGNAATELAQYSSPLLYHATASYAAGIREGLERFGWLE